MGPGPEIAVSDGTILQATSKLHRHISKCRTDNLDIVHDTARKKAARLNLSQIDKDDML